MTAKTLFAVKPTLFILVLMVSVGPFGDTIYAPSLPSLSAAFKTPYHNVQLTITFYLLGYSVGQILYGPFSDYFGRKPVMIFGALMFLAGSSICLLSLNITILIFGRFIQGIGACAGAVISSAAIRDAFPQKEQSKVFAKMNAAFAMAPGIGAIVGTFISWQMNFIVLFVLAIALVIAVIWLFPETLINKNKEALQMKKFFSNYYNLFKAKGYFIYLCILGINIGMVYSCLVEAPVIVIDILELSKPWFIVVAVGIVIAFMLGSIICNFLCHKLPQEWILMIGMLTSLIGAAVLFGLMLLDIVSLLSLLIPVIVIFTGIAFVIPIAIAKALSPFTLTVGSASAMMGFFQMGAASAITAGTTFLPFGDLLTLPISFIILATLGILIFSIYMCWPRSALMHESKN
jgi:MFS transporter, DHA1 family, multidrug resistance protein